MIGIRLLGSETNSFNIWRKLGSQIFLTNCSNLELWREKSLMYMSRGWIWDGGGINDGDYNMMCELVRAGYKGNMGLDDELF